MNTYLAAINAPVDNDYGKGADKYTVSKGCHQNIQPVPIPAPAENGQQQSQQQSQQQTNQGQQQRRSNSLPSSKVTSSINSCSHRLYVPLYTGCLR